MNTARKSISGIGIAVALAAACSSGGGGDAATTTGGAGGGAGTPGAKGGAVGTGGNATGGSGTTGGTSTNTGGTTPGTGGAGPTGGAAPGTGGGGGGPVTGGVGGVGAGGVAMTGGTAGIGGSDPAQGGSAGAAAGSGGTPPVLPTLVTSTQGAYWKTDGMLADSTATATVTVNDTQVAQTWEGFGGSFNELGWMYLTSQEMKDTAIRLLFSAGEGANFAWGRIPMGASDYAISRFTMDDTAGADPVPSGESNRPAGDPTLASFSLSRDLTNLIPYIKAAQMVKSDLRFWASPWTPPVWMKTEFKENSGADSSQPAMRPSFYDGGNMKSDEATLTAYALYFTKFVEGYDEQGIDIEVVSPQNEPGYDQNYPSCLWDAATYTTFIGQHLGPAMDLLGVDVMLGTLSNATAGKDFTNAAAAVADATARSYLTVIGAQWNTLDAAQLNALNSNLPVWASEHKCGNYPWNPPESPAYQQTAPNDHAYAVESWGYIRDAIVNVRVTAYNAWNMVLDQVGLGIDTTRHWAQNALLVANGGQVTPTPTYYVFRHMSQYAQPGAQVVSTTGGNAVAFKNPDGSIVVTMYNSGGANPAYVVQVGAVKKQFAMPGNGWATVLIRP